MSALDRLLCVLVPCVCTSYVPFTVWPFKELYTMMTPSASQITEAITCPADETVFAFFSGGHVKCFYCFDCCLVSDLKCGIRVPSVVTNRYKNLPWLASKSARLSRVWSDVKLWNCPSWYFLHGQSFCYNGLSSPLWSAYSTSTMALWFTVSWILGIDLPATFELCCQPRYGSMGKDIFS